MPADIASFFHAPTSTWSHVVSDPATGAAAVIDPVLDFDPASGRLGDEAVRQLLQHLQDRRLDPQWILETHAHADHLSGAAWLREKTGAPVAIGRGIVHVQATFKRLLGLDDAFEADGAPFDRLLDDGERLPLGTLEVQVLATPGHTSDSLSYRVGDAVFIGDTLFSPAAGSARCDFPGGDAVALYASVHRLYALPPETRLFLCHDYPPAGVEPRACVPLTEEMHANIHLAASVDEADFLAMRTQRDATLAVPRLLWLALQVNIRAGRLPPADAEGRRFLKLPLKTAALDMVS